MLQTLTEDQIKSLEEIEDAEVINETENLTDEECNEMFEKYLEITASSSGGLFPNCSVAGGSCSGC